MVVIALAVVGLALLSRSAGTLTAVEQRSIDARFALRGDHAAPNVAVVGLDSASYAQLPRPPLPRTLDATVIDHLHAAGARVIALDLSLERRGPTRSGDRAIIAALEQGRPAVVFGDRGRATGYDQAARGTSTFCQGHRRAPGTNGHSHSRL